MPRSAPASVCAPTTPTTLAPAGGECLAARPPVPARRPRLSCCHPSAAPPGRGSLPAPGPAPRPPCRRNDACCYLSRAPAGTCVRRCAARTPAASPRHSQSCCHSSAAAPARCTVAPPGPAPRRPRCQAR
eukprot:scaffold704_cov347-Prasinococcus_capsulatus_cf.AAC.40